MDLSKDIVKIKELTDTAKDILIVTHEHPTADSIGSSLATYLGLIGLGKRVSIACPDPMTVDLSHYIGINKITPVLGKKNFVISLDYIDGSIEKVSYNIEGDKFNLIVEPRIGFEPFSEEKVHYSHAGTVADLIIAIDTIHLGGLKKVYEDEKELFATKPILVIDCHPNNAMFGALNIVDSAASSSAEIVAHILSGLGVKLTIDIANNLLNAVYEATNNFTNAGVTVTAFDVAAVCLRAGAKRFVSSLGSGEVSTDEIAGVNSQSVPMTQIGLTPNTKTGSIPSSVVSSAFLPSSDQNNAQKSAPSFGVTQAPPQTGISPDPHVGQPKKTPQTGSPAGGQDPLRQSSGQAGQGVQAAPEDWLKPKIFKSGSRLS